MQTIETKYGEERPVGSIERMLRASTALGSEPQLGETPASTTENRWLTPGRFALFLMILVLLSFPGVIIGTRTFVFRDYGLFSYPVAFFQRQCFWRGELPLWNPYSQCGLPFLAQWNTICLYPPALFYLLFPLTWALPVFCLAHLVWGGVGMFLLAREWAGNRVGAAVAGIIFAFNGLSLNFLMWPSQIATLSWLPWMWWLVPRAWRDGGRNLFWAVLAGALQMLAGGPETIALTWLTLGLLAIGDWWQNVHARGKIALRFWGIVLVVAVLCAAQLLPFLQLLAYSQRDRGFGSTGWAMPISGWANLLVPLFRTSPTPQGVCFQPGQYWTSSYYLGIGTVLLVILGITRGPGWRVRLFAILLLAGLVLALGNGGLIYAVLRALIPSVGFVRYPVKFVILCVAVAPVLAAVGLDNFSKRCKRHYHFEIGSVFGIVAAIAAILALGLIFPYGHSKSLPQNAASRAGLLVIAYALLVSLRRQSLTTQKALPILLSSMLLLTFWIDLTTAVPTQNPTASPAVYDRESVVQERHWSAGPALGHSRAMLSPTAQNALKNTSIASPDQTYLLERLDLLADCNLIENIPQVHGFFSLAPAQINNATAVPYVQTNLAFSALLDFMGVSQIAGSGDIFNWERRPTAMPLVSAGQRPVFVDDATAFSALARPDLDLRKVVLLPPGAQVLIKSEGAVDAKAKLVTFGTHQLVLKTTSSTPCVVTIAQTWYPAWKAYLDKRPTRLWRANYAFQAVEVPAGKHQVELKYEDRSFMAGAGLSALGLLILAGWFLRTRKPLIYADER